MLSPQPFYPVASSSTVGFARQGVWRHSASAPASARPTEFAMLAGRRRRRPDPHASHGRPEPCGGWGSGGREPAKDLRTTSDQREGGPCKFSGPFFGNHTPIISSPFIPLQPHPRVGGHFRRAARCRRDGPAGLHRPACRPACLPRADPCKHASTSPNIPERGRGQGMGGRGGKASFSHPTLPPSVQGEWGRGGLGLLRLQ